MFPSLCSLLAIIMIMMNSITAKIHKFGRIRTLHSMIISQETIKPSSPTPSHLKTHNLSLIDYLSPNIHMPLVLFYKNFNNNINILKKSLSHSLTQYYPFAGRLHSPHIDCNDEGVEFLDASVHSRLDDFILKEDQDETLDQLIPNALGCAVNKTSPHMVAVQLSHFTCGGVSVAVTVSHKAADGFTMVNFVNHWATLTRGELPINPRFFSPTSTNNFEIPELSQLSGDTQQVRYANRRFVFPNSRLNELKKKINAMGASPLDPTRVESLTSLLFKCAATTGSLRPLISLNHLVNLRGKKNENFPQLAPGNFYAVATAMIKNSSQIELNEVIMSQRKERMEVQGVRDVEEAGKKMVDTWMTLLDDQIQSYSFSSLCRFPFYQADFGWGNPARVMLRSGNLDTNFIVLMDTPSGDGIEATVQLEEEDMAIFQKNEELHAYMSHPGPAGTDRVFPSGGKFPGRDILSDNQT